MLRLLLSCVAGAAVVSGSLAQTSDVIVPLAVSSLMETSYGNSAKWEGQAGGKNRLQFQVAYSTDGSPYTVDIQIYAGDSAERVAHEIVEAWAALGTGMPVYQDDDKVIFPPARGLSVSQMRVRVGTVYSPMPDYSTSPTPTPTGNGSLTVINAQYP